MVQKLLHFIKYHNAFTLMVAVLVVGSGAFAASDDLRSSVISSEEKVVSVDNTYLLNTDLDSFDPRLQITDIKEDDERYYVTYRSKTLGIEDYVWKELEEEKILKVDKALLKLKNRDLGLYVAEELGEVAAYAVSYLKEVQNKEKQIGRSQKVATVEYAGLIGRFLEPEEKVFPGYVPVVAERPADEPAQPSRNAEPGPAQANPDVIRQLVKEEVDRILKEKESAAQTASPSGSGSPSETSQTVSTSTPEQPASEPQPTATSSEPIPTPEPQSAPAPEPAPTPAPEPEPNPSPAANPPATEPAAEPAPLPPAE